MMGNKTILAIAVASTMWLLSSCIKDSLFLEPVTETEGGEEVVFSLQLPGAGTPTRSFELEGAEETHIETIDVLVFQPNGGGFLYMREGYNLAIDGATSIRTFTVRLLTGDCDLVLLANARDLINQSFPSGISSATPRADVEKGLQLALAGKWNTAPASASYLHIPMFGEKVNVTINSETKLVGNNGVNLVRMVARVDVSVAAAAAADFKLQQVEVYNYMGIGQVMPSSSNWSNAAGKVTAPSIPVVSGAPAAVTKGPLVYDEKADPSQSVNYFGDIYILESSMGSRAGFLGNTCLVLGGYYNGKLNYYRVDFVQVENDEDVYLPILRNHRYTVEVQKISGPGFDSSEDAFKSLPINISASVVPWNTGGMTDIYDDGQYYFKTSQNPINLSGMAGTSALNIETDCPDWKYVLSDNSDPEVTPGTVGWLSLTSVFNPDTKYTASTASLTFSYQANSGTASRKAYIHIWSGRFVITIEIVQHAWYISRVHITPDDADAASGGGTYTVTIEGRFDTPIPIRVRTAEGDELDNAAVAGPTAGSNTLDIPAYWLKQAGQRQLVFEYQNGLDGQWVQIIAPTQSAYWLDIKISDADLAEIRDFTGWGSYIDMFFYGNFPTLPIRVAYNEGGLVAGVNHPDIPAQNLPAGQYTTRKIYIPYNDNTNVDADGRKTYRSIAFQYWDGTIDQVGDEAWKTQFEIIQREGNRILDTTPYELWTENIYSSITNPNDYRYNPYYGVNEIAGSYAANGVRVLSHQNYDLLGSGFGECSNWYEAMGITIPDLNGGLGTPLADQYAYTFGKAAEEYLNYNYSLNKPTGCGLYYERDFGKFDGSKTVWMVPTYLEVNRVKNEMEQTLQSPMMRGWQNMPQKPSPNKVWIYTSTELSDYHYRDEFGTIYDGIKARTQPLQTQEPVDVVKTTSILVSLTVGSNASNMYPMDYTRKNGSMKVQAHDTNTQTRCVRTWNKATDIGGPGYVPTFNW